MARSPRPSSTNGKAAKQVDALKHTEATRRNIPTAEMESFFRRDEDSAPREPKRYPRQRPLAEGEHRTPEEPSQPELIWNGAKITITAAQMKELAETGTLTLSDAQLVWRGKDRQDWTDLVVNVPPLYIQEKIHPKAIIDDLKRRTMENREAAADTLDLFADFNGISPDQRAEFYQHDQHWSNRMILGDSLQVMASLAERESLKGKVQCIYFDPPYGIKFNSNWQVSTQSRDVKDGKQVDISREPEQVKAFRDTWKDGIHSYLTYLRDRLTVMRDLLTESGSVFVQIGDENVHRVRAMMDEIFGAENFVSLIAITKGAAGLSASGRMPARLDYIIWYGKQSGRIKYRQIYTLKSEGSDPNFTWVILPSGERRRRTEIEREGGSLPEGALLGQDVSLTKPGPGAKYEIEHMGRRFNSGSRWWGTTKPQLERALKTDRIIVIGNSLRHLRYLHESSLTAIGNLWDGFLGQNAPVYVVQTNVELVQRCILMATDPGDLVLDPTCGSGTTAYVAEQWGRRWITVDTSRVALALARTRLMSARYPWYLLADSREGRAKEAELVRRPPSEAAIHNDIRQGFVYERVPHITLKSIVNNTLIDEIWEKWQPVIEPLLVDLNTVVGKSYEGWQVPRHLPTDASEAAKEAHAKWWEARIARQREIDASIAARADVEYLYDKPYVDTSRVRVAGPFAGSAGTGKTVVALHRAVRLARDNPSARVLLATFSQPLADELAKKLLVLAPDTDGVVPRITTASFRGIAEQMFQLEHGVRPRIASDGVLRDRLRTAASAASLKGFSERFLLSEWTNVIDAWGLTTLDAYSTVQRMGRKSRLGPNQRARLWPVFQAVREALAAESYTTWANVFTGLADALAKRESKPFDHVVIDEAQDLAPAELRFFATLAPAAKDGLFLSGDVGQRIFQHPFSWTSLGVDVRGRSQTLKVCYRTSQQIRRAADRLLPTILRDTDGLEDERRGIISVFDGPAPEVKSFDTAAAEEQAIRQTVEAWLGGGIAPHEIGLFVRTPQLVPRARAAITGLLGEGEMTTAPMSLAKGLEFRAVVVMACDEGVLPLDERVADAADEAELDDIYETERRLLYVASTRAREHLLLTGVNPVSTYLADISP